MSFATVIIPHWRSPRWIQICLSSLQACKNNTPFETWVVDNSPGHDSIKAIDNRLSENVKIVTIPIEEMRTPALALDWAIDEIQTPWLFAAETDIRFMRDGWLDWYKNQMPDEHIAMIGWYWQLAPFEHDTRHYIAPSATLYNNEVLKILKAGCIANKQIVISHGRDYTDRKPIIKTGDVMGMIERGNWGPFAERRGFFHSYPVCEHHDVFWHDTGSWLFYRAECQWECVRVPGMWVKQEMNMCPPMKYTYIGETYENAYILHYWGGGVSHSFEVNDVVGGWAADCQEWWLRREQRLWEEVVPPDIREESIKNGIVPDIEEEIAYANSKVNRDA